jgi:hypothetical protein
VAAGVERRVRQHGDADELDLVEQAVRIVAASATGPGRAAAVVVELERGGFRTQARGDGIIRAHHVAHGAADTVVGRVRALADAVIDGKPRLARFGQGFGGLENAFAEHPELDGVDRAHGCATPAQGAGVDVPVNLPRQIVDA